MYQPTKDLLKYFEKLCNLKKEQDLKEAAFMVLFCLCGLGCGASIQFKPWGEERAAAIRKNYELGKVYRVEVGNPLIQVENGYKRRVFIPSKVYEVPDAWNKKMPQLTPLQGWYVGYVTSLDNGFVIVSRDYPNNWVAIHILPKEEGIWKVVHGWLSPQMGERATQGDWKEEVLFQERQEFVKGDYAAELIYSGISQDTLRIVYREYVNDLARPAFYQELTYNLHESKPIKFKSITLEIIEATNSALTLTVIDDGGLTWVPKGANGQ